MTVERSVLTCPALLVAPRLIGAVICSNVGEESVSIRLTEVEAYEGSDDPASHAFRGPTARTSVMFGPVGHLYVYFTYGMHWCANIVCEAEGRASAVLLRGGQVVDGLPTARDRRPAARSDSELARGPARLAACLALGQAQNDVDLCRVGSPVELVSVPRRRGAVQAGPRVGITRAVERPWRFWAPDDPTVSAFRAGGRQPRGGVRHTGQP
jgi:DNA-3-methyladenine glycosylase